MNRTEAVEIIKQTLKSIVTHTGKNITEDTPLAGGDAFILDSFMLTTLVIELEQAIHDKYGKDISIVSDKMFSENRTPMKTVGTLADFLLELME